MCIHLFSCIVAGMDRHFPVGVRIFILIFQEGIHSYSYTCNEAHRYFRVLYVHGYLSVSLFWGIMIHERLIPSLHHV